MAYYRIDYQLEKAQKVVAELGDSEKDMLLKYYIGKKKETIKKQSEELNRYREFFSMLRTLLPRVPSTSDIIG